MSDLILKPFYFVHIRSYPFEAAILCYHAKSVQQVNFLKAKRLSFILYFSRAGTLISKVMFPAAIILWITIIRDKR